MQWPAAVDHSQTLSAILPVHFQYIVYIVVQVLVAQRFNPPLCLHHEFYIIRHQFVVFSVLGNTLVNNCTNLLDPNRRAKASHFCASVSAKSSKSLGSGCNRLLQAIARSLCHSSMLQLVATEFKYSAILIGCSLLSNQFLPRWCRNL